MRVAALYDIPGNLPALRAVLAAVADEDVHTLVIGGDVASGPLPRETIEQLMAISDRSRFVRGNADREIVDAYDDALPALAGELDPALRAAAFAAERISHAQRDFLGGFVQSVGLDVDGLGPALFCHGSPKSDTEIITRVTPDERLTAMFQGVSEPLIVCGHTHQQFDRSVADLRVVNAGSVGAPYEGRPGAYWALLGPEVELRCTDYDVDQAVDEMRGGGFPDLVELLRDSLFEPAAPDEVTALFERMATASD